ncbi:t-SNARE [Metschnikowia bicuspidata var. bicuspidata NRRL YB-4993]|uniref:t-SNARE affecting a late Golgi compartment protein 1 n=1 Tax=Metschnikowia bicuspidata var. bicuspidata NRRL YB-4993 TaxID=869754 RepID=A0A1A0H5Z2_9ASCO|nr:t-SNARE [Metschnikowia bicuspidata var. bicuspidata NRRL YB-4993]OBA19451.1 t-SNARE [Metschnikowia bicuspidata var. bicuspidata NRRL YB-4993]
MDPFNEVEEDCWAQIHALQSLVSSTKQITGERKLDFQNDYQELAETLEDLRQAVHISELNPAQFSLTSSDIADRKQILAHLQKKIHDLNDTWNELVTNPHRPREVTTMSNRISQEGSENPFADDLRLDREFDLFQQQEVIQSQDLQLDLIHKTMQNLNQQAALMGNELEDQGYMLDDLDNEMDAVGNKLQRGLRRVNHVIERNRETASNWCIGILVVVLCILLVVLIAV